MIHCEVQICVGCKMCEVACSSFHCGAVSPAMSRIRVAKLEAIGIDMAVACVSCDEKPCLICPVDALAVGASGEIVVDVEVCTACEECMVECPVGAIGFYQDLPPYCDLCDGQTRCVEVCPSGVLTFRKEHREICLDELAGESGNPSEKRARYAAVRAQPLRQRWIEDG